MLIVDLLNKNWDSFVFSFLAKIFSGSISKTISKFYSDF
jgi:hypothetical protein